MINFELQSKSLSFSSIALQTHNSVTNTNQEADIILYFHRNIHFFFYYFLSGVHL